MHHKEQESLQDIQKIFDDAFRHYRIGKLSEAEKLYHHILSIDSCHADSMHFLGFISHANGHREAAIEFIVKAIRCRGNVAIYHHNLGSILREYGKLDEAIESYDAALIINPNLAETHNNLGIALLQQGKSDKASECFKRAIAIKSDFADAYSNLGATFQEQGNLADAVACYNHVLTINPECASVYNNLGGILQGQGNLDDSVAHYKRSLAIQPNCAETHYNLGNTFQEQNKLEEAAAHFRRCLELDPLDHHGVRLLLAGIGAEIMPERASEARLQKLYNSRANSWDKHENDATSYQGHQMVANALNKLNYSSKKLDILDAGCGTGLVGELIRNIAKNLDGIDFSPAMLEQAKTKGIYDQLYLGDLIIFLTQAPQKYDIITCAATLIHFGDLRPAFQSAAIALRNGGLFIFTLFSNDNEEDGKDISVAPGSLGKGGCYAHGRNYINLLAEETGFVVEILDTNIHEYNNGKPMIGLVVALRRSKDGIIKVV